MFFVGKPNVRATRLVEVAREGMWLGIQELAPGKHLGDVGAAIQKHVEKNRFSIVREYCGHGIGRQFHEDPQVLHYGKPGTGMTLRSGMTRTVVTKDHSLSAQWEHTILITDDGFEVLTLGAADR